MKKFIFFTVSICIIALTGCNSKTNIENTLKSYKWVNVSDGYKDDERVEYTHILTFEGNSRGNDSDEIYYYSDEEIGEWGKWGFYYYISGNTINCVYDEGGYYVWPATRTLTFHDTYLLDENGKRFERK